MDWRFVASMGALGLIVGVLRVMGWLGQQELFIWLGIAFIWVATAVRKVPKAPFQHVLMASLVAWFLAADLPAIFWETFVANNPGIQPLLAPEEGPPLTRTTYLLGNLIPGALFGVFVGLVAMLATRSARRTRQRLEPSSEERVEPLGAHMDITHPGSGGMSGALGGGMGAAVSLDSDDSEE